MNYKSKMDNIITASAAYLHHVNVTGAVQGADPTAESTAPSVPVTDTVALFKPPVPQSSHVVFHL